MARKCFICKKEAGRGNQVSHSNIKTKRKFKANLQKVRILVNGKTKRELVCTKCLKKGKVKKAV